MTHGDEKPTVYDAVIKSFVPMVFLTMFISCGLMIAVNAGANVAFTNGIRDSIQAQVTAHAEFHSQDGCAIHVQWLRTIDRSVVGFSSGFFTHTTRTDYSQGDVERFFDLDLKQPLGTDERHMYETSFGASSWMYPNSNIDTVLSEGAETNVNRTAHWNSVVQDLYVYYPDVLQVYLGLADDLFVKYPGNLTNRTTPYYATSRGWYDFDGDVTPVYIDFNFGTTVATVRAETYTSSSKTTKAGTVGADIKTEKLNELVDRLTLLETGKVTIYESNGAVFADRDVIDTTFVPTYKDLTSPLIDDNVWDVISSTEIDSTSTHQFTSSETQETYIVVQSHPSDYNGKYICSTTAKESEMYANIQSLIDENNIKNRDRILIVVGIAVAVIILMSIAAVVIIKREIAPWGEIENKIDDVGIEMMKPRLEGDDALPVEDDDFVPVEGDTQETYELREAAHGASVAMRGALNRMRQTSQLNNPFYGRESQATFGVVAMKGGGGIFPDMEEIPLATYVGPSSDGAVAVNIDPDYESKTTRPIYPPQRIQPHVQLEPPKN